MDIDPQAIVAALAAGKNAIDSTLSLLRSDVTLEKSELKLRLAGAVEELAKAKVALTDAGDAIRERDDEILRLRNALSARSGPSAPNMVKGGDAYFDFSVASGWSGDPCCMRCWERDREKVHLATAPPEQDAARLPTMRLRGELARDPRHSRSRAAQALAASGKVTSKPVSPLSYTTSERTCSRRRVSSPDRSPDCL